MKYSPELCLFFAPAINIYKRHQPGSWVPTRMAWATDNRTTGFCVVGHGSSFRPENRMPGADANPYLGFADMLAAGRVGVETVARGTGATPMRTPPGPGVRQLAAALDRHPNRARRILLIAVSPRKSGNSAPALRGASRCREKRRGKAPEATLAGRPILHQHHTKPHIAATNT